jgi:hypothetical protein
MGQYSLAITFFEFHSFALVIPSIADSGRLPFPEMLITLLLSLKETDETAILHI